MVIKNTRLCLILVLAMALLCVQGYEAQAATPSTTLMVYMIGSDLESADAEQPSATMDLKEMMAASSASSVNVLVQTGGSSRWYTPGISSSSNQRWKIDQGRLNLLEDVGPLNMGLPGTLADFVSWSIEEYPADRYILVMWDHGSGSVQGFGADELYDYDGLLLNELDQALAEVKAVSGERLDMVGFDACLMANIETASVMSPYADYMVASEEVEPGNGWDYEAIINYLVKNPASSMEQVGKTIADSFRQQCIEYETGEYITLSVMDLSRTAAVVAALDKLITSVDSLMDAPNGVADLARARMRSETYGQYSESDYCSDMVDLYGLARELSSQMPAQSGALQNAIDDAVVYNLHSPGKPYASGLSIYFPAEARANFQGRADIYQDIPFSESYVDFIMEYTAMLLEDDTAIMTDNETLSLIQLDDDGVATDEYYEIQVDPAELENLAEVRSVLGAYLEDAVEGETGTDIILYIGLDNDVEVDQTTGVLHSAVAHAWDMMQGQFVAMYYMESGDDFWEYYTPAVLNGQEVDIVIIYNDQYPDGKVLGAKPVDENTGDKLPKDFIVIKGGDSIIPVYYYENVRDPEDYGWIQGEEFIVEGSELKVDYDILPTGEYLYGFWLKDYAGNTSSSEFVSVYHDEDDWYIPGLEDDNQEPYLDYFGYQIPVNNSEVIQVVLDGETLEFAVDPAIVNQRVMVPMRVIFEALGADVVWDSLTGSAVATRDETLIMLPLGSLMAMVNDLSVPIDAAPLVVDNTMLVPLRFVSESLDARVEWIPENNTVLIISQ